MISHSYNYFAGCIDIGIWIAYTNGNKTFFDNLINMATGINYLAR